MKRESDAVAPLELCRAELAAPLHVTEVAEDGCRDLNTLAGRLFARDRDALRRVETAQSRSGDGYGLISAIQSATRHYTSESVSIWGDACMQMARRQAELMEALTSGSGAWRAFCFSPLQKLPGVEAPIGSFSAWLQACQDPIVHGAAPSHEAHATQSPIHQATGTGV
ncbi:hypothetical protein K788_0004529 [Paraburkholderia caribensis MBA4]|uniref:Phasin protein n=1 Tax=Paraburkholderia caribensis MBA4 TaxID=1323664 RepID=A0A0P0RA89_9BURK|nr:hypothetical protein [Paraburkholderia caribensis]ALL65279.1 hypothetical protein K788_0004529 [Paraburkholderia caribensis MBA4]